MYKNPNPNLESLAMALRGNRLQNGKMYRYPQGQSMSPAYGKPQGQTRDLMYRVGIDGLGLKPQHLTGSNTGNKPMGTWQSAGTKPAQVNPRLLDNRADAFSMAGRAQGAAQRYSNPRYK